MKLNKLRLYNAKYFRSGNTHFIFYKDRVSSFKRYNKSTKLKTTQFQYDSVRTPFPFFWVTFCALLYLHNVNSIHHMQTRI